MPELPEVENMVRGLKEKVRGRTFLDFWTDTPKIIQKPQNVSLFKKDIKGKKIKSVLRRGKYIVFNLSGGKLLLFHQKMTGHLLFGKWKMEAGKWKSEQETMQDKMNLFIHALFFLDNGKMVAFSDLRKFGWIQLWDKAEFEKRKPLSLLGPEPLGPGFRFDDFAGLFAGRRGRIKTLLMNQGFLAGIGNIYADEILWKAKISPEKRADRLSEKEKRGLYKAMRGILNKAVEKGGTSVSDYRRPNGKKGAYQRRLNVYKREGEKCPRCGTRIKRKKIGGRSAYYCPKCQKLDSVIKERRPSVVYNN